MRTVLFSGRVGDSRFFRDIFQIDGLIDTECIKNIEKAVEENLGMDSAVVLSFQVLEE